MTAHDPELSEWLKTYQVAEADSALLDRIVAAASCVPQQKKDVIARFPMRVWAANTGAFAAIALLGFWVGTSSPASVVSVTGQLSSSREAYLEKILFGPTSWKEVSL